MKQLLFGLLAAMALGGVSTSSALAEDRIAGYRYVEEAGDLSKGEVTRTKVFNLAGDLVGINTRFKDGKVRNENIRQGTLRAVHETDFHGWSRDVELNKNGALITESIRRSGKSVVFVNVDALGTQAKDVYLAVGDELHVVYSLDPWPGSRSDSVSLKNKGVLNSLTTTPKIPSNTKLLSAGSYVSVAKGDNELTVNTTLTRAGFPGPHGRPPQSSKTTVTIKVHVK